MGRKGNSKNIRQMIRSELNKSLETKHHDSVSGAFDYIPSTGVLYNLNAIDTGTADNERIGNRVTLTKLHINKIVRLAYSANTSSNGVRFMVVKSRGAPLVLADMPSYYGPADLSVMYVLDDQMFQVTGQPNLALTNWDPNRGFRYRFTKKWKNGLNLEFEDSALIASDNNLYLYMISEVAVNNAEQAGFNTVYYKDA